MAPAVPPAQRADFLVTGSSDADLNDKTALLFPDSAPLTQYAVSADRKALPPVGKKRKGMPDASTLDYQAVWTHVTKPPEAEEVAVLVFLHGFYAFVTITPTGECAWPSWVDTDFNDAKTARLKRETGAPPPSAKDLCASAGYEVVESVKRFKRPLLVIAPENARAAERVGRQMKPLNIPVKYIKNQNDIFSDKDALGTLIQECFQRLTVVKAPADRTQSPPPLKSIPKKISRLFLAAHSGAFTQLYNCAKSAIALDLPTDLILLDCFYDSGHKELGIFGDSKEAKKAEERLGNDPGQSRIILVRGESTLTVFDSMQQDLQRRYKNKVKVIEEKDFFSGKEDPLTAMRQFPVVIFRLTKGHYTIPEVFLPWVLATAK